jgi:hypothetical protein
MLDPTGEEFDEGGTLTTLKNFRKTRDKLIKASHLLDAYLNPIATLCIVSPCSLIYALFFHIAIDL